MAFCFLISLPSNSPAQLLVKDLSLPCKNYSWTLQPSRSGDPSHTGESKKMAQDIQNLEPHLSPVFEALQKTFYKVESPRVQIDENNLLDFWKSAFPSLPLTQIYFDSEWKKIRATLFPGLRMSFYFRPLDHLIEVSLYKSRLNANAEMNDHAIGIDAQDEENQVYTSPILKLFYKQNQPESAQLTHFKEDGRIRFFSLYQGAELESVRQVDVNPPVMQMESLYSLEKGCRPEEIDKIRKVTQRTDRTLIAILDLGVDYNHPAVAFRIPRVEPEVLQATRQMIAARRQMLSKDASQAIGLSSGRSQLDVQGSVSKIDLQKEIRELEKSISIGWDFREDDSLPYDFFTHAMNYSQIYDHGTHVAHIAAGNFDEIAILPLSHPNGDEELFYESVRFSHARGARVMNISLGHRDPQYFKGLDRAMKDFPSMLFVIAAGNESMDLDDEIKNQAYPPSYTIQRTNRIIVAAHDAEGKLWPSSNRGAKFVDIAALGVNVMSFRANTHIKPESGTSMATPQVSRVAARIFHLRPDLNPREVREIILKTARPLISRDESLKLLSGGQLNEEAALLMAQTYQTGKKTRSSTDRLRTK